VQVLLLLADSKPSIYPYQPDEKEQSFVELAQEQVMLKVFELYLDFSLVEFFLNL
jgi:hypothetical protein